jgi:hypothetical protein
MFGNNGNEVVFLMTPNDFSRLLYNFQVLKRIFPNTKKRAIEFYVHKGTLDPNRIAA